MIFEEQKLALSWEKAHDWVSKNPGCGMADSAFHRLSMGQSGLLTKSDVLGRHSSLSLLKTPDLIYNSQIVTLCKWSHSKEFLVLINLQMKTLNTQCLAQSLAYIWSLKKYLLFVLAGLAHRIENRPVD